MAIKKLSVKLLNQIAAGEVVERPASVVKELLENAVDSGASRIVLTVENAGKSLIRVTDNGCGIDSSELSLALEAHATSKIASTEDLANITTLGFRGEALASISSVSKLSLTSRTKDSDNGSAIYAHGLERDNTIYPAAHPVGSSVEVCELFFNTPARRRFLKSDKTEFLHIRDIFIKTALANPALQFEFINDGKRLFFVKESDVAQKTKLIERIASLIGSEFSNALYCAHESRALSIDGFILPPPENIADSATDAIYLFLNSRVIADRVLLHAIRQAYITVYGRTCPCRAVLYLRCSPADIDVNVHPRKDEVRFHEQRLVHDTLQEVLASALLEHMNLTQRNSASEDGYTHDLFGDDISKLSGTSTDDSRSAEAPARIQAGSQSVFDSQTLKTLNSNTLCTGGETKVFNLNDFLGRTDSSGPDNSSLNTRKNTESNDGAAFNGKISKDEQGETKGSFNGSFSVSEKHKESCNQENTEADFSAEQAGSAQRELSQADNAIAASRRVSPEAALEFANRYDRNIQDRKELERIDFAGIHRADGNIGGSIKDLHYYGILLSQIFFVRYDGTYYLIKMKDFVLSSLAYDYMLSFRLGSIKKHKLAMPFEIKTDRELLKKIKLAHIDFERLGFEITLKTTSVALGAVPYTLKDMVLSSSMQGILEAVVSYSSKLENSDCPYELCRFLFDCMDNTKISENMLIEILQKQSFKELLKLISQSSYTKVDLASIALELLNNQRH